VLSPGWRPAQPIDDLILAPVALDEAVAALRRVGRARRPGVYQLTGPRDVSHYELAVELAGGPALVRRVCARAAGVPEGFLPRHATLARHLR
jgi:hypothetical protein